MNSNTTTSDQFDDEASIRNNRSRTVCRILCISWILFLTVIGVSLALINNDDTRRYARIVILPIYVVSLVGLLFGYVCRCCCWHSKRVQVELPSDLDLHANNTSRQPNSSNTKGMDDTDKTLQTVTTGDSTKKGDTNLISDIVETISDHFATVLFPNKSIPTPIQTETDESTSDDDNDDDDDDVEALRPNPQLNMSGTYKLVHSIDYDDFLKGLSIPWALRRAAGATRPTHIITHTDNIFKLQIEGIVKSESTFVINGSGIETRIRHMRFWDTITYLESGDGIQTHKVGIDVGESTSTAKEIIVTRQFNKGGGVLVMTSKAIFPDGSETKSAIQTFHKIK